MAGYSIKEIEQLSQIVQAPIDNTIKGALTVKLSNGKYRHK